MAEQDVPVSNILTAFEIAFTNALANTLSIIADNHENIDAERLAEKVCGTVMDRVLTHVERATGPAVVRRSPR